MHWQFVRNPDESNVSFTERPSHVRIWTGAGDLDEISARNVIVRRERHHSYEASLKLDFLPECEGEQAGLICYYDSRCFIKLCLTYDNGRKLKLIENRARTLSVLESIPVDSDDGTIYLKASVRGMERTFFYSLDNNVWKEAGAVPDALFLSDEGTLEKKAFTGTMTGFFANHGGSGRRIAADIDWFAYRPHSKSMKGCTGRNLGFGAALTYVAARDSREAIFLYSDIDREEQQSK